MSCFSKKNLSLPFHLILIAVLGTLIYSNTFDVPFVYDDTNFIVDNPFVKDISNAEAHYNLGLTYKMADPVENAAREFKAALKINPKYQKALEHLERIENDE
jgi:tetratricopeptide (TPR) repeat protein